MIQAKNTYSERDVPDYGSATKFREKSKRKLRISQRFHDPSSSIYSSHIRGIDSNVQNHKGQASELNGQYFKERYSGKGKNMENISKQMQELLEAKMINLQSQRIYRDELKFLYLYNKKVCPPKINYMTLKEKAKLEEKMLNQKLEINNFLRESEEETEILKAYIQMVTEVVKEPPKTKEVIDFQQQQEIRINNLEMESNHLIKELTEEKRKNIRELRYLQEQIQELRIQIQQKQDTLRDYKAKLCTLHIKLHNRKMSKNKERNLSLSIKKFNDNNHKSIKQAFIGNNTFKKFSKQILEKVSSDQELIKVRFYSNEKENLSFQCLYKSRQGQKHSFLTQQRNDDGELTRDKEVEENENMEEVFVKYLFSIKFYYKSKIVGVEYRVKTEKGNKHIQIGNCSPNVQHELLTLINKEVVTMGSFWHRKEMIGVSIWYSDKLNLGQKSESKIASSMKRLNNKKKIQKSYDQYYA